MTRLIDSLKSFLPQLGKQATQVREAVAELRGRKAALQVQRADLLAQSVSREDYASTVCASIDRAADLYEERMKMYFSRRAEGIESHGHYRATFENVHRVLSGRSGESIFGSPLASHELFSMRDGIPAVVQLYLLREPIKEATRRTIEAIDPWPVQSLATVSEMLQRLAEIDAELAQVNADLAEILAQAKQLGIDADSPPSSAD
jgi:hypothetical protein